MRENSVKESLSSFGPVQRKNQTKTKAIQTNKQNKPYQNQQ
jgi:hypothetical protein